MQDEEDGPSVALSAREFAAYRLLYGASVSSRAYQAELRDQACLELLDHSFTRHAVQVWDAREKATADVGVVDIIADHQKLQSDGFVPTDTVDYLASTLICNHQHAIFSCILTTKT